MTEAKTFSGNATLGQPASSGAEQADDGSPSALARSGYLDLAMLAAGTAAYHWDVQADVVTWSANADQVLGVPADALGSNGRYSQMILPGSGRGRADAVHAGAQDDGAGVFFETSYALKPDGCCPSIAVEEAGRWFAGPDGLPAHVFGVVRRANGRAQPPAYLEYLSTHDTQTNLLNRELILEMLKAAVERAKNGTEPGAFLMMSVDNLQQINEIFGTDVADCVISEVGQRVQKVMRAGDLVGRFAGNRLALVLRHCESHEMRIATQRFLQAVSDRVIDTPHGPTWATVSIGGTSLTSSTADPRHALLSAEHALKEARQQADGQFFTDTFPEDWVGVHERNMEQAAILLSAIQNERVSLALHPVRRVADNSVVMYDVAPYIGTAEGNGRAVPDVIATAKTVGLIGQIDVYVLKSALAALEESDDLILCVPLAVATLEQPRTRAQVLDSVKAAGHRASQLVIDIHSPDLTGASRNCLAALQKMQRLGARLLLSGFGMHAFPLHHVHETDGHFVRMDLHQLREAISSTLARRRIETAVEIARSFGSEILVSGIDPQRDADVLASYRVDLVRHAANPASTAGADPVRPLKNDVLRLNAALTELEQKLSQRSSTTTLSSGGKDPGNPRIVPFEVPQDNGEPR